MQEELLVLEQFEEEAPLLQDQMLRKYWLISELFKISEEEELYWKQKSHDRLLHEGDINTEYFHRIANGRKRRNLILKLEDGDRSIEGDSDLLAHATEYYKKLFGPELGNSFPLDPALWDEEDKVNEPENALLCQPFSEEEIKFALFQMEKTKQQDQTKFQLSSIRLVGISLNLTSSNFLKTSTQATYLSAGWTMVLSPSSLKSKMLPKSNSLDQFVFWIVFTSGSLKL